MVEATAAVAAVVAEVTLAAAAATVVEDTAAVEVTGMCKFNKRVASCEAFCLSRFSLLFMR